ncbi:unnamed protein product [Urochloa humidicola]
METVAGAGGGLPLPIPEGPFFDVLSRLSIKDHHRLTCLSSQWRDVFINFPDSRKNLPQTLQGFFHVSCDCRRNGDGGDDRDSDDKGDGARGDDIDSDSTCSHNYGLHFDLLAKSSPLTDDTDTKFSFIQSPDQVGGIDLLCSCNGLLLFGCGEGSDSYHSHGYIVCNPATKQYRAVPSSGWVPPEDEERDEEFETTFLFFDPDVPSRFLLIQFWHDEDGALDLTGHEGGVHIYSSMTGTWSDRSSEWMQFARGGEWGDKYGVNINSCLGSSFLNGMLHFFVKRMHTKDVLIVAVDGEGSICRIMRRPLTIYNRAVFIGQSQGLLHCISENFTDEDIDQRDQIIMSVDVLEDYEAEKWETDKFSIWGGNLSGGEECRGEDYTVVAFHPDGNLIYFVDHKKGGLIQYDVGGNYPENEQVLRLCNHYHSFDAVTPYVPCFSWSSALDTNH